MRVPVRVWPRAALTVARTYGLRGGTRRALHELRRAVGGFRLEPRFADRVGRAGALPPSPVFSVDAGRLTSATDVSAALERADRVAAGEHQAYRWDWRPLPEGNGWLTHPRTGRSGDGAAPWWRVPDLDRDFGDIKDLWEPARFAWSYDLVRGYLLTGEDRYARAFHRRLQDWIESSPPFRGPHWSCGQEASIRAAALLFAEANLEGAPSSTPAAMERIGWVLAASGERIDDAFGYALSQRNNHGISEAAGLVLLGSRFRGRHPRAERWLRRGRTWLERLIRIQFAPDGWYIQHSFNYLRLALDQAVLARRVLDDLGYPNSPACTDRIEAAVALIAQAMEPTRGIVPNHGPNDGAFVRPTTLADYRDFRATLTAVCATYGIPLPAQIPADPEALAWLGADDPVAGPPSPDGVRTGESGWAAARIHGTGVFLRAGRYRSRPGHIDPLHLDVRFGRRETIVDPGTFSYNAPPLDRELTRARSHNGPLLDEEEPGLRGPRFLWLTWPDAVVRRVDGREGMACISAEIPGRVRRRVTVRADEVVVEDEAVDPSAREIMVRWLLHPDAPEDCLELSAVNGPASTTSNAARAELPPGPGGLTISRESGWFSPRYGEKNCATLLVARMPAAPGAALVTRITPGRNGAA